MHRAETLCSYSDTTGAQEANSRHLCSRRDRPRSKAAALRWRAATSMDCALPSSPVRAKSERVLPPWAAHNRFSTANSRSVNRKTTSCCFRLVIRIRTGRQVSAPSLVSIVDSLSIGRTDRVQFSEKEGCPVSELEAAALRGDALRANIAETLLVPLIRVQGGKEIQHEKHEDKVADPVRRRWH